MAEQDQSRSEEATQHKLDQARKRGSVARGQDLTTFVVVAAAASYLWMHGGLTGDRLARMMQRAIVQAPNLIAGPQELWIWSSGIVTEAFRSMTPLVLSVLGAALLSILVQIGFVFAPSSLKPDFERLNPMRAIKRLFSIQTVFDAVKSILKLLLYGLVAFLLIQKAAQHVMSTSGDPLLTISQMYQYGTRLLFWLAGAMAIFAAIDLIFVRWQFNRQMKMSRRELREEARHREGDPQIKRQRKKTQMELLKKARALRAMRGADVLITNPTHYAIALRYDEKTMLAPTAVAKGAGDFALRLKRLALIYRVPVIESPVLARAVFFKVPMDQPIAPYMFEATAKIYMEVRRIKSGADKI